MAITNQFHPQHVPALPQEGFARLRQVLAVVPVSRSSWFAGIKSGKYPKPVKLGPRTAAWRVEEIRALLENPPAVESSKLPTKKALPTAAELAAQA